MLGKLWREDPHFAALKHKIAITLINAFACLCAVALPASLFRWYDIGFQPVYLVHCFLSFAVLLCYLGKHKISDDWIIGLVLFVLTAMIISGPLSFGLQSGTVTFVSFCVFLIGFVYGKWHGILYLAVWGLFTAAIGFGFTQGMLTYSIEPNIYAGILGSWMIVIIGTVITAAFVLLSGQAIFQEFIRLFDLLQARNESLKTLAQQDPLTGLMNVRACEQAFEQAIYIAKRREEKIAVAFIDLDDFKLVNDQHGHDVGDQVLCELADRILESKRDADLACRIGGDEFLIAITMLNNEEDAHDALQRYIDCIKNSQSSLKDFIKLSIGLAYYPNDGESFSELKRVADHRMYQAKNNK